jgi:hypothetical protein
MTFSYPKNPCHALTTLCSLRLEILMKNHHEGLTYCNSYHLSDYIIFEKPKKKEFFFKKALNYQMYARAPSQVILYVKTSWFS